MPRKNKPKKTNKPLPPQPARRAEMKSPEDIDIDELYEKYKDDPRFQQCTTMKNPKCIGGIPDFR